jgi:hypothetical protein
MGKQAVGVKTCNRCGRGKPETDFEMNGCGNQRRKTCRKCRDSKRRIRGGVDVVLRNRDELARAFFDFQRAVARPGDVGNMVARC